MNEHKQFSCVAGKACMMNICTVQPVQYNTDKGARVLGVCISQIQAQHSTLKTAMVASAGYP